MFTADLHVHSKFSRATSRDLDLPHLAFWAARKGIAVLGTGDCVHPGWLAEIKRDLIADGGGLYRLAPAIEAEVLASLPGACREAARFLLTTEISTIYKKDGRTRKVHHVILLPDIAAAERLAERLARVGNIASDGRPILGLDSRDLLEIVLETDPQAYLVPAHVWTPWFSALGAQSGFDSVAACYGDLADHIFAVETGLSSDPAMNWRVSSLDRYRLVSNSDAHSPAKLGREATRFDAEPSFAAIRTALETGAGYRGTVEFFPEEGKYHLDGHRGCATRLDPQETLACGGRCPVCGKPVTIGVAHRVEVLADRAAPVSPSTAGRVESFVPLPEILAEILGTGPASKAVAEAYAKTAILGPELTVLGAVPLEDISHHDPVLGEAVRRLRSGDVRREAGYDGEYGVIRLFAPGERDRLINGAMLFSVPCIAAPRHKRAAHRVDKVSDADTLPVATLSDASVFAGLDSDQKAVVTAHGPLMAIAGPGSGKTRVLTQRIAYLVTEQSVPAERCLAVTFTRRATEELRTRLDRLQVPGCVVHSFHSLGLAILQAEGAAIGLSDFRIATEAERTAALIEALHLSASEATKMLHRLSALKRSGETGTAEEELARRSLERWGRETGTLDFDDLVILAAKVLETVPAPRWRFAHVLADEFQDIDPWQYRLLKAVTAEGGELAAIGDPDQAIYGFRGADETCFTRFAVDFPTAATLRLERNYRSSGAIVTASAVLMGRAGGKAMRPAGTAVDMCVADDERGEAAFVVETIAEMMGGHDMLTANRSEIGGFGDFAVLYRTDAQAAVLRAAFDEAGIPYQKSRPARLAEHPGVMAILARLPANGDLSDRIAAAAAVAEGDVAALAEARGWLLSLAQETDEPTWRTRVALATEADFRDPRADRVSLLTMHAAKGLEFAVVFVVGLEDGVTPYGIDAEAQDRAEERRLFYVAMTRAKDRLFLTRAHYRFWRGAKRALPPSFFLAGLTLRERKPRPRKPVQYKLF